MCPHGDVGAARNPIKKGRLVQQRMAHAAVTPVEQRQSPLIAAKIARMEVAVDQRVSNAASGHIVEPAGKTAHKIGERCAILSGDFVARALDDFGDRGAERGRAPIGQSQREQFCSGSSAKYRSLPTISASSMRPPSWLSTVGTHAPAMRARSAPSWAKKYGTTFSHTVWPSTGTRHRLERFHVRTCVGGAVGRSPRSAKRARAQARSAAGPPGRA
jgi:hypothetical protein